MVRRVGWKYLWLISLASLSATHFSPQGRSCLVPSGSPDPMNFAKLSVKHCSPLYFTPAGFAPAPRGGKQKPPRDVVVVLVRDGKQPGVGQGSSRVALYLVWPARRQRRACPAWRRSPGPAAHQGNGVLDATAMNSRRPHAKSAWSGYLGDKFNKRSFFISDYLTWR